MFPDIIPSLIGLFVDKLRQNKKLRNTLTIIFLLINILIGLTILLSKSLFIIEISQELKQVLYFVFGISAFLLGLSLTAFTNIKIGKAELTIELEGIREEREKIIERIEKKENNVLDTIQLSLNQLTEYYTINLSQAKSSYRWSITAIIVGLITLIIGIWFIFFNKNPNYSIATISAISGIIIEFIGASNIFIYNKSIKQLNIYFKELIKIQDTMLAVELCEGIKDNDSKKLEVKEKIILALMGRSSITD